MYCGLTREFHPSSWVSIHFLYREGDHPIHTTCVHILPLYTPSEGGVHTMSFMIDVLASRSITASLGHSRVSHPLGVLSEMLRGHPKCTHPRCPCNNVSFYYSRTLGHLRDIQKLAYPFYSWTSSLDF